MKFTLIFALSLLVVSVSAVADDVLEIKPGLWEFTTNMKSNMMGSKTSTDTECIKEKFLDPKEMLDDMPKAQCKTTTEKIENGISVSSVCNMDGAEQTMIGEFITHGSSIQADMTMKTSMQGMTMEMTMQMQGKRINDC